MNRNIPPPSPARRPHALASVGGTRIDEYFWLRDDERRDPEVLAHLAAENAYADAVLAPLVPLRDLLYREMVARLPPEDVSVPWRLRDHLYFQRFRAGGEHPLILRRGLDAHAPEVILLDVDELARGHDYYQVNGWSVSPNERVVACAEDRSGRRLHTLRFRDIGSGAWLDDRIEHASSSIAWMADGQRLLYVEKDLETLSGVRLRCHLLGTDPARDPVLYEESDDAFELSVTSSKDERYALLAAGNWATTEWRFIDVRDTTPVLRMFLARETGHEYEPEHFDGRWYVRSNWQAPNFRIVAAPAGAEADRAAWTDVVAHRDDTFIHDFELFAAGLAIEEQHRAQRRIRVQRWDGGGFVLDSGDAVVTHELDANEHLEATQLRIVRTSPTMPDETCDIDLATGAVVVLKRETVNGYDASRYTADRRWVDARDGERVPVTITRRRDVPLDGRAPLLLHGYGAYGVCEDPVFSRTLLSLLDRGFVHAIAHVRGGQELGRRWFDAGRILQRSNTSGDFIDVARALVADGSVDRARVFATGGSAGGLLVAVATNEAPDLFRGIVALVPFVDVLTTMLDETIPLTSLEHDIWGDPTDPAVHACIAAYSPYDNLQPAVYPAIYAATGLWDSQVQYFEPAKWVARLRDRMTGGGPVLLRVDLDAGHGGKPGRYQHLHEVAEQQAFLIHLATPAPIGDPAPT
jgi:oligopeptidase B